MVLVDDHVREDDGWSWQFEAAVWEPDRGTDGKMTAFAVSLRAVSYCGGGIRVTA